MNSAGIDVSESLVFNLFREAERLIEVKVEGTSMWPLIRPGDMVSLRLSDGSELKAGDLMVFRQSGNLIVHRFLKRRWIDNTVCFCQKGDNLLGWSWIPANEVLGKVESIRGMDKRIDMDTRLWNRINRAGGVSGLLWVSVVGKARLLGEIIRVGKRDHE